MKKRNRKSPTKIRIKQCLYEDHLFKTQKPIQLRRHVESKHEGIIHFRCEYMNCTNETDNIKTRLNTSKHKTR